MDFIKPVIAAVVARWFWEIAIAHALFFEHVNETAFRILRSAFVALVVILVLLGDISPRFWIFAYCVFFIFLFITDKEV